MRRQVESSLRIVSLDLTQWIRISFVGHGWMFYLEVDAQMAYVGAM